MKKRLISGLLIGMLMAGMFVGCGNTIISPSPKPVAAPTKEHKTVNTDIKVIGGMDEFDSGLIEFLDAKDYVNTNYMISPTSYRAALCLAIAGANGETKEELLKAAGFENEEQMNTWYSLVYNSTVDFNDWLEADQDDFESVKDNDDYYVDGDAPDAAFRIVNSVWANESRGGKFRKEYIEKVEKEYAATAASVKGDKITDEVNKWVNDSTNGQIPKLADDLTDYKLILTNALYLRAPWVDEFEEYQTVKDDFKTFAGNKVTKDFMNQVDRFRYYEEDGGKLVILPLKYGVNTAFVLGEIEDIDKAIANAEVWDVDVKLPKMEISSEFGSDVMIGYLNDRGATSAFCDGADFSEMTDAGVMIDEIIQKTKIKTDEEGLEAAAVTAIMMLESAAMPTEEPEIKEFHATEPFEFIVYTELENEENEILFYGQMVE